MKKYFFIPLMVFGFAASGQTKQAADTTAKGFPVLKSYVAPDAVERAKKKFGRSLYSIEKSTAANCEQSYLVGLIRNGKLSMEWMCDDPKLAYRHGRSAPFGDVIAASKMAAHDYNSSVGILLAIA